MILDTHMKTRRQAGVRPLRIFAVLVACHAVPAMAQDGGALYKEHCANCHDRRVDRAPGPDVLRAMSPQRILEVLEFGSMVSMTHGRTTAERRAMAEFASGKSLNERFTIEPAPKAMCRSNSVVHRRAVTARLEWVRTEPDERAIPTVHRRAVRGRRSQTQTEMGIRPSG